MTSRKMGATGAAVVLALAASIVPASAVTEDLSTVAHTTFTGSVAGTRLGETLAPAGDFDGDGLDDAVAGGRDEAVVLLGGARGSFPADAGSRVVRLELSTLARNQTLSVAGAGDVDGDGFDDVLVGVSRGDPHGRKDAGTVLLVFGSAEPGDRTIDEDDAPGVVRIDGAAASDRAGTSVAPAGDVDGDGIPDVIVGARGAGSRGRGAAYVLYGDALRADVDLAELGAKGYRIHDPASGRDVGWSVASAGDMNADGLGDVIVGAPADLVTARPASYVVFGRRAAADVSLRDLGSGGWTIAAGDDEDQEGAGEAVAGGRDVDGDGIPDVVVGAPSAAGRYGLNGAAYVIFGKTGSSTVALDDLGDDGYRIDGGPNSIDLGHSVALAPDLDGNGHADVLVGAPWERHGRGSDATYGAAYHLVGQASTEPVDLGRLGADGVRYVEGAGRAGTSVAAVGDFDGDGITDVGTGVPAWDVEETDDAGRIRLFNPIAPPAYDPPPSARLVSYVTHQRAEHGSYCWDGLCADRRPTFPRRRKAGTGDRAHFWILFPDAPDDVALTAYRELDEFGRPSGEGTPIRAGTRPLRFYRGAPPAGHQIVFHLPDEPGDVYLSAFARWDGLERGDVSWFSHLLLEDRAAHTRIPNPPRAVLISGSARQRGAVSSYCWSNTSSNGSGVTQCSDSFRGEPRPAAAARAGARARIRIHTQHRPDRVRLKLYRTTRHGYPCCEGRRVDYRLTPHRFDGEVTAWDVRFRLPERRGHVYPDMNATWRAHGTAPYDWHLLLR